jgi:hypothetical protein
MDHRALAIVPCNEDAGRHARIEMIFQANLQLRRGTEACTRQDVIEDSRDARPVSGSPNCTRCMFHAMNEQYFVRWTRIITAGAMFKTCPMWKVCLNLVVSASIGMQSESAFA